MGKHGGRRKNAGRPNLDKRKITLSLTPQTIEIAKLLGNGVSDGIEKAVSFIKEMRPKIIYSDNKSLNFINGKLATVDEYTSADKCIGSIFESLSEGELIVLKEGIYKLDKELNIAQTLFHI